MNRISRRIASIAPSATLAVDAKAKALKAAGRDVIGFGAGEPDFPTPPHIVEAAQKAAGELWAHKYSPTPGLPQLRAAIAAKTARDSGLSVEASQVLVTNGGKQAVYNTFATLLDPGDEVLLLAPYWVTYPEAIALAGGVPVTVESDPARGFRVRLEDLEAAVTDRTKVLLFVSPSNPTGAVYSPAEVKEIGDWAAARGLWVVTDEIYEHLVYGNAEHVSMPVVSDLGDRWVVLNGCAKSWSMTGWRVGWMISAQDVIEAASALQTHATSNVCNVAQAAAIAAVSDDLSSTFEMRGAFDERRRTIVSMLNEIDGIECFEPEGAFYAFPDLRGAFSPKTGGSSAEFAERLLEEVGVAIVPGEAFGAPGFARLSYALDTESMVEGVTRIRKFVEGR